MSLEFGCSRSQCLWGFDGTLLAYRGFVAEMFDVVSARLKSFLDTRRGQRQCRSIVDDC
jgi:hypothetical protein